MKKVKDNKNIENKVSLVQPIEKICFSFAHVTSNKSYNMDYFKSGTEKSNAFDALFSRLNELSRVSIKDIQFYPKENGFEKLPWNQLSESVQHICDSIDVVSRDSKLTIFRFGNQRYRLLCKDDVIHSNLMYVIALDLDFSAYNH